MQLDINWLHKERKEGRRSGRTTEMLANAVGVALVAENDTDIHIICGSGNEMTMWHSFIEVLWAISPTTTYFRNIHKNRPCITIPIGEILVRVVFGNESPAMTWRHKDESEKPVDEAWFFDHFWEEELKRKFNELRPRGFISEITPYFSSRGGSYW